MAANLIVKYYTEVYSRTGPELVARNCWTVKIEDHPTAGTQTVVLYGFKRQLDAEIALSWLSTLLVDWSEPQNIVWDRLKFLGYNNRQELMNEACKHLQW